MTSKPPTDDSADRPDQEYIGGLAPDGSGGWKVNRHFLTPERLAILQRMAERRSQDEDAGGLGAGTETQ